MTTHPLLDSLTDAELREHVSTLFEEVHGVPPLLPNLPADERRATLMLMAYNLNNFLATR